jgi:hypothetical protein
VLFRGNKINNQHRRQHQNRRRRGHETLSGSIPNSELEMSLLTSSPAANTALRSLVRMSIIGRAGIWSRPECMEKHKDGSDRQKNWRQEQGHQRKAGAGGGTTLTAIKNERRAELEPLVRSLAAYVQANCQGSLSILLSSGFPNQKTERQPIGQLPAPQNVTLTLGSHSGELDAAANPV